ncbi:MAG: phenylalanine--tRNA ligase subunit beta [Clostridia bacterium]|nr:phenylalanine--tRNA ligase subunit beta [Clostridia bacterium]
MIAPFSWLKEYVDIKVTAEELQEKLFSCGFEVEELTYLGAGIENVVTGKILSTEKHPDADRLTVCKVDCGAHGEKQIVTAATNIFAGAIVPIALDNSTVKHEGGIQKIKTGKLRGVTSEGMFCSGEELGINNDFYEGAEVNGILILDNDTPLGVDIRPVVGIDDYLFDIAITANRPDCQCIFGIAREVAAALKAPLKAPDCTYKTVPTDKKITVEVKEPALCPRYMGHYVEGVKIGVSPRALRRRLALCGLRSVSNIVDITNYVLLEMGQPMHAFDYNYLKGGKIIVRRAKNGEKITTLDEHEFTLNESNLLIADGERGVALAGVMGGLNSEIKEDTQAVFFEAAKFARDSVRKTSRSLGLRSDSSARFEKGVDAYTTAIALDRALHLVEELGAGKVTSYRTDSMKEKLSPKTIKTEYAKLNALLGIEVPEKEVNEILNRLGFTVKQSGKTLSAEVPLWREDVDGYPDLAEEVIRMYGYEHIEPTFLEKAKVTRGGYTAEQKQELAIKNALKEEGFYEACNYSFYSPKSFNLFRLSEDAPERRAVKILNPIGEDLSVMRTFLAPSMLDNVVRNVRRGNTEGRLFELAKVYVADELPLKELPQEKTRLVMAEWGGGFFDLKGAIEGVAEAMGFTLKFEKEAQPFLHPGISAAILLGEKKIGWIGELHPSICEELALEKAPFLLELDFEALPAKKPLRVEPLPAFPDITRDIAFTVEESVTCAQAEECILHAVKAVKKAELFDVYRGLQVGKNKKSMAFRLTFASEADKAVSPETVDGYFKKILGALKAKLGAELR